MPADGAIDALLTRKDEAIRESLKSFEAEQARGAIGVHCKAGLGRTGTLISLYLMKHYGMTTPELIGWLRLCRPGSVIGPQQNFLGDMEKRMWREGEAHRRRGPESPPPASAMSTAMKGLSVSGSGPRCSPSGSAHSSPNASPNPMRPPRASEQARAGILPFSCQLLKQQLQMLEIKVLSMREMICKEDI